MTKNKAQKSAIRQRMAETGEPYSVARHAVEASQPGRGRGLGRGILRRRCSQRRHHRGGIQGPGGSGQPAARSAHRGRSGGRRARYAVAAGSRAGWRPASQRAATAGARGCPRHAAHAADRRPCRPCHRDSPGRPGERPGAGRYSSPRMRSASSARSCRRRRPRRTRPRRRRPRRRSGPPGCRNRPAGRGSEPAGRGSERPGGGASWPGGGASQPGRGTSRPGGGTSRPDGGRSRPGGGLGWPGRAGRR